MKMLLSNRNFLLIMVCIGGAVGVFNGLITMLQQMMCSRGYDPWMSGLCGSLMLGTGFLGVIAAIWGFSKLEV